MAVLVAGVACGGSEPGPSSADALVVLLDSSPRSLDPRFALDSTSNRLSQLVFSALVSVDNPRLEPELDLADRLEVDAADPRVWHVWVRRGAAFHDGEPITGRDVAFTYQSVLDPDVGSPLRGEYASRIARIETHPADPYHVTFHLRQPFATFRTDLALGIVPAHVLQSAPRHQFEPHRPLVGSGAFRLVSPLDDLALRVELERTTPSGADAVRRVVFRVVRDENARILSLLAESSHLVFNSVTPLLQGELASRDHLRLLRSPSISLTYVGLNLREPRLADPRVREALALAVDREEIVAQRFEGRAVLANGMFAPTHWAHASDVALTPHDPARAEALLDSAGLRRDPSTGIRFELDLKLSTNRFRVGLARAIARDWMAIGVQAHVRSYEFSSFFADVRQGRFQAFLLSLPEPVEPDMLRWMFDSLAVPIRAGQPDAETAYGRSDRRAFVPDLSALLGDQAPSDCREWAREALGEGVRRLAEHAAGLDPVVGSGNRTFLSDPRLDCLLARGRREMGRAARAEIYAEAQRIVADIRPIIPLWHEDQTAIVHERVEGLRLLPNGRYGTLRDVRWSQKSHRE